MYLNPSFHHLLLDARGWSQRLFGCIHFGLLSIGDVSCWIEATASEYSDAENNDNNSIITIRSKLSSSNKAYFSLWYDIPLGCSGVATTLTAAKDFPHRLVRQWLFVFCFYCCLAKKWPVAVIAITPWSHTGSIGEYFGCCWTLPILWNFSPDPGQAKGLVTGIYDRPSKAPDDGS